MQTPYTLDASQLFTLFFIVFGPLKLLAPFAKATHGLTQAQINSLAIKAILIIAPVLVVLSYTGMSLLQNWQVPLGTLVITGGLIFAYVAFMIILGPKEASSPNSTPEQPLNPLNIALTMILTPYGIASLIVVLTLSHEVQRTLLIFAILFGNLFLNLLSMIFVRKIMGKAGAITLQILGAVLGVLQAAMAVYMIQKGFEML